MFYGCWCVFKNVYVLYLQFWFYLYAVLSISVERWFSVLQMESGSVHMCMKASTTEGKSVVAWLFSAYTLDVENSVFLGHFFLHMQGWGWVWIFLVPVLTWLTVQWLDLDAPEIITKLSSGSDDKDVDITLRLNENLTSSSPLRAVQEFLCQGHLAQETEA